MAVAVDALGSNSHNDTSGTSFNYTGLTISAGLTNPAAVFAVGWNTTVTSPSATWNGVSCPLICSNVSGSVATTALFGIVNPTSGNKTLAVSWTGSAAIQVSGVSFSGVNQTGGTTSFPHANTVGTSGTVNTMTVTTQSGNYTIGATQIGTPGAPPFVSSPTGTIYANNNDTTTGNDFQGLTVASTGTSTTYTSNNSSSDAIAMVGCDVNAAAASSPTTHYVLQNFLTLTYNPY